MSSTLSASSSAPLVALAHSVNSSGRLGLFVDPFNCSCDTCTDYPAELPPSPAATEPAPSTSLSALATPPPLIRSALGLPPPVYRAGALGRAPANHLWTGSDWVHQDSPYARSPAVARVLFPEPESASFPPSQPSSAEEAVMDSLRSLRADLQIRQDQVYSAEARSHDEMSMQDAEWDELDRKIQAIEQTLLAFGSFFRTR
jgi:hypothetical protein